MDGEVLQINSLTKVYPGGKRAVDGLNLSVKAGEIFGFIGHNGAGKSTTIRAVCGVMDFDEGDVLIGGKSVRREPLSCKRETAYLPDNPELYEFMTGAQYIALIADLYGVSAVDRQERMAHFAQLFGMADSLQEMIGAYSHGMRQKTALIGALVHSPKLMVLDEPFVGLDPEASFHLKAVMRTMCEQGGAIFFSTHVLEVAEKLCDRVGIIKQGRLIACGTVHEVAGSGTLEEVFMAEANGREA